METHRRLAHWLEGYRTENNVTIRYLFWGYRAARFGVIIQVGAWAVRLATNVTMASKPPPPPPPAKLGIPETRDGNVPAPPKRPS
jgi:hypothetical protein